MSAVPEPQSITDYVADGARIAAILLIWGVIAAFFSYGVTEFTSSFERVFTQLGELLIVVGFLNALLYMLYRTVDYWHETA
ncbi:MULTISPECIES: hypothetical protein [unclassified Halorubrum]|uniref:hypothetical protein n=1 Tax=unclassified Halorubrum TaxID=2642239 RepID=UPI000B98524D|nr:MULTISPECIES: hypothetical protein [unclassified Halorubrum]OYR38250.1 hypothetical protein DJ81_18190 [Halorubrum sp. Hd13]OYR50094.1 hypothetical protein DJ74_07020 [Halorubrum sp. Ea8]